RPEATTPAEATPPATPQDTAPATPQVTAQPSTQSTAQPTADGSRSDQREESRGLELVDYLAAATLACAGLLAALGRRRREQLWRRAFGWRIARPRGDAAEAEVAIRLGADAP